MLLFFFLERRTERRGEGVVCFVRVVSRCLKSAEVSGERKREEGGEEQEGGKQCNGAIAVVVCDSQT